MSSIRSRGCGARLIHAALLVGGSVTVPDGQAVGGTFQNLPLCTDTDQPGCVIAYRSYADGFPPASGSNVVDPDPGLDTACTNPAALRRGWQGAIRRDVLAAACEPTRPSGRHGFGLPISTPFAVYHGFYTGECVKDDHRKLSADRLYTRGRRPAPKPHPVRQRSSRRASSVPMCWITAGRSAI
jgi:hypothetical protein